MLAIGNSAQKFRSDGDVLIMADLNGRLGEVTKDITWNTQGRRLHELLHSYSLTPIVLELPKQFTCYTNNGGTSINDLLLVPDNPDHDADSPPTQLVTQFKVHQEISLGSDHRLLTFQVKAPPFPPPKPGRTRS